MDPRSCPRGDKNRHYSRTRGERNTSMHGPLGRGCFDAYNVQGHIVSCPYAY